MIFISTSMATNWNGLFQVLLFLDAGVMLAAVLYNWVFKKMIFNIRSEYGDVIADEIVRRIKVKSIKHLKYFAVVVIFLGGGILWALRGLPIPVLLLIIILLLGAFIIIIIKNALMAAGVEQGRLYDVR